MNTIILHINHLGDMPYNTPPLLVHVSNVNIHVDSNKDTNVTAVACSLPRLLQEIVNEETKEKRRTPAEKIRAQAFKDLRSGAWYHLMAVADGYLEEGDTLSSEAYAEIIKTKRYPAYDRNGKFFWRPMIPSDARVSDEVLSKLDYASFLPWEVYSHERVSVKHPQKAYAHQVLEDNYGRLIHDPIGFNELDQAFWAAADAYRAHFKRIGR